MDVLISGSDTIKDLRRLQLENNKILNSAGFLLRKWSSNNEEVLQHIREEFDQPSK